MLECLHLRPQFLVFEAALRVRAEALSRLDDERFATMRGFEKDAGGLRVISDLVAGHRLIDLLETRPDDGAVSGIDAAFGFLLQAMPALAELHTQSITHGALGPGRIIITPNSQVVLLDSIYGNTLERLALSPRALWTSFGILTPSVAGAAPINRDTDVGQVALCALLLAGGRSLEDTADTSALVPLVREVAELAEIRAGSIFAEGVRHFFTDTLPAPGKRRSLSAEDAAVEIRRLLTHLSEDDSLNALAELVRSLPVVRPRTGAMSEVVLDVRPEARQVDAAPKRPATVKPQMIAALTPNSVTPPSVPIVAPQTRADIPTITAAPVGVTPAAAAPTPASVSVSAAPAPPVAQRISFTPLTPQSRVSEQEAVAPIANPTPPPASAPAPPVTAPHARIPVGPPLTGPPPPAPALSVPAMAPAPIGTQPPATLLKIRDEKPAGYAPIRIKASENVPAAEPTARALSFLDRAENDSGGGFMWKIAAAAVLVLLVGAAAGRDYLLGGTAVVETAPAAVAPAPAPASTTTGSLVIESQPAGAKVLLDGKQVGVTPLTLDAVKAGRHQLTITSGAALVQRSIRVEAGKAAMVNVPVFSGWVAIFAPIRLEVSTGRRSLGSTDSGRIMLPPGRHVLTLSNAEFNYTGSQTVEISPGEERVLNLRPTGTVNVNASPWAEVWVDGTRAGETPLANLEVPLGTREFLFKHPQFGERKLTATITTTSSALSVDFGRPPSRP